jgi:putative phosphoribosyl transferase
MICFEDRSEAGHQLARRLAEECVQVDQVFAIPRGGLVAGASVAAGFECPLRPAWVAKIRHPLQPEYAIGAVDISGQVTLALEADDELPASDIASEITRAKRVLTSRYSRYLPGTPVSEAVHGQTWVLVDDGLATGQTCLAALKWLRAKGPRHLLLAVPCASLSGLSRVRPHCDGVVTVFPPDPYFTSVGAYYRNFEQVSEEEALQVLKVANQPFNFRRTAA